jgi:chromosome condensin MukBEF complex kleisin-like MukF subunit
MALRAVGSGMNVCQIHLVMLMQHVIIQTDLTFVHVILDTVVMDLHAMVSKQSMSIRLWITTKQGPGNNFLVTVRIVLQ